MNAARFRESWRDLLHATDREPEDNWRALAAHHGVRGLVILVLAVGLPLLFPGSAGPEQGGIEPGTVAKADVIAAFDLPVPKPADQLERERAARERTVLPVFRLDPFAVDSSVTRVRRFLDELGTALASTEDVGDESVRSVLSSYGVSLGPDQLEYLRSSTNRRSLTASLERAYESLLPAGVATAQALGSYEQERVLLRGTPEEVAARRDSLTTLVEFAEDAFNRFAPASLQGFRSFQSLVLALTVPSLRPDERAWMAAREVARAQVDSTVGTILQGERIITAHERVGQAEFERLQAYNAELERRRGTLISRGGALAGRTLFTVLLLGLAGTCLFLFRPGAYHELRHYLIIVGLTALVVAGAALVQRLGLPAELIPVVLVALAVGSVYDGMVALVVVLISTLLVLGLASVAPLYDPAVLAMGGSVAALGVRGVRRRRQSWMLIAGITGAYFVTGLSLMLLGGFRFETLGGTVAWGFLGATLFTILALSGLVPLLEKITGISTAQTLLELSDLNAPLLRDLSLKAPGTYAHSINIANLAEAACEVIGADSLQVRAGAYYHDIGKMVNPQYFVENQPKGRNPHDRIPPPRSAAIIRDHVRDGIRLATEHRLPPIIHDFIREHHGTGLIRYFYDQALEQAEEPGDVNPGDYAYLGPKPQSRETAVVMLADGIESATRVLGDPTPERIHGTIEAIVGARLAEGQLDQCPLTLREIDQAKAAFARVLIGMYHRRIDYPGGVTARGELPGVSEPPPPPSEEPPPREARVRPAKRKAPEDQLEAALEAGGSEAEKRARAADE